jgi:hypothetical protein
MPLSKFTLEVRLDSGNQDNEVFKNALNAFDMRVRKLAIENKKSWFGKAADDIENENGLRQMHTMSIKKGNEKADGSFWDSTVKFKITGRKVATWTKSCTRARAIRSTLVDVKMALQACQFSGPRRS